MSQILQKLKDKVLIENKLLLNPFIVYHEKNTLKIIKKTNINIYKTLKIKHIDGSDCLLIFMDDKIPFSIHSCNCFQFYENVILSYFTN